MGGKKWGKNEFLGVGSEFDPDWVYDEEQMALRSNLIEICRTKIRPQAIKSDQTYEYPRESLKAMAQVGLIGLIVPKELGGLGQSHVCAVMIIETLARYGCPSTAMIFSMHLQATSILLFRYHDNEEIKDLLRRMNSEVLIGSSSYSDPATGGHFWFPLTSKSQKVDEDHYKVFRFNSWTTSAGFADFYVFQTPTPDVTTDHSNLTGFFAYKDEVRASTDNWVSLGLHGNQSGPLVVEGVLHKSRMIGRPGDGPKSNDETGAVFFLLCTTSVWNGIAMGCIDLARKHTTEKTHGDLGKKVCDYPVVQDYVGGCISETNSCRSLILMLALQMDSVTEKSNWALHEDPNFSPRSTYVLWLMQAKHNASENVSKVADRMLKACGGDGYKADLGLERLFRDAQAGCLMAPTNEIVRNLIGKGSLIGLHSLDMWDKIADHETVHHEIKKMTLEEKRELLSILAEDVNLEENSTVLKHPYQDSDFENPFNTSAPKHVQAYTTSDGIQRNPALTPNDWNSLELVSRADINDVTTNFIFSYLNSVDQSGCLPGQYVQVRIQDAGKFHERYFSPVSPPNSFGILELAIRFETHGIVSKYFRDLEQGSKVEFLGPCGGFEYEQGDLEELTLIASGNGITPGLQIIRCSASNPDDRVNVTLIYYAKSAEELLYKEELEGMSKNFDQFRLILTVAESSENWTGEDGPISLKMIDKYVVKPNGKKQKIILCGGPGMTISCLHSLRTLKYPSEMIFIYGQFGTEQIRKVYGRNVKLSGHRCDNVV